MPSLSVFGAQWGDEGKGKIIDRLAREADFVVRYQGGANAGHTVVVGDQTYVLHLVPSGILHAGRTNVIAAGVALDPARLVAELDGLVERGVQLSEGSLRVSAGAHVIFDHHRQIDGLSEQWKGAGRIGTTGRGIGPAYADKASRTGLRISDLLDPERCRVRLAAALAEKNAVIEKVHGGDPIGLDAEHERFVALGERLAPYVCDTGALVRRAYRDGKSILFEGAQGAMLDLDHGTYPYVTSSSTGATGIPAGVGFPPHQINEIYGIAKAYCTRVGEGPFPSEETGAMGERLREAGNEYGATTGRPRRCGWFDALAVRYALELNGATGLVVTNLDVLTGFSELKVATSYSTPNGRVTEYPAELATVEDVTPEYESRPGFDEDVSGVRQWDDLPQSARDYVTWLEELVGVPIVMLSVGPERDAVIPRSL